MLFNKNEPDIVEKAAAAQALMTKILEKIQAFYEPVSVDSLLLSDVEAMQMIESETAPCLANRQQQGCVS